MTVGITLVLLAAVLCVMMIWVIINFTTLHFVPDSVASILLGVAVGFGFLYFNPEIKLSDAIFFDPQAFFLIILPLIMYDAGYSSNKSEFFRNFGTIFILSFLGTLMSTLIIGVTLFFMCFIID